MKFSILFATDNLTFGGGERCFSQIIRGLDREKFNVHIACNLGGRFEEELTGAGIEIEPVGMTSRYNPLTISKLIKIIKRKNVTILHSQGGRVDFYARMAARMLNLKVKAVNTIQMPVEGYDVGALRKGVYRFFDRFSERYVDRFIVVSEVLRETLLGGHKIQPDKVIKIYNGIELSEYYPDDSGESFRSIRKAYNIGEEVFLIGAVGRMVWQKGFEYLIECVPEIVRLYPDAKILIVGDGPLRERLEALSKELRVRDNVIFTGVRSDIKEILSAIDILVIPSLLEGFPMITLEAMAMAKPIIATNIDGITEQITDGVDGILVPPQKPSAIAKAVIQVLSDKELARTMGLSARGKVEREFSVEKMVAETEKVYLSLLGAN